MQQSCGLKLVDISIQSLALFIPLYYAYSFAMRVAHIWF
jgi:hypothetical protein